MTAIIGGAHILISDDDLRRICEQNPGWEFERSDDGALLVSPTSTPGGAKSGEAFGQLRDYARTAGGEAYDAGTGLKTPQGGIVSPDAAWLNAEHVRRHANDDGYWQTMPDVVIEVASRTDAWAAVKAKIDKYLSDGAAYAIAIDPQTRRSLCARTMPGGSATRHRRRHRRVMR